MYQGIYTADEFNIEGAKHYFNSLKDKYKLTNDMTIEVINNYIEDLIISFNTYERAPKFVITRALYSNGDNCLSYARFIIRPSVSYDLTVRNMRESITIIGDSNFFNNLIDSVANWFDRYTYYAQIEVNVEYFNLEVKKLIKKHNINLNLNFTIGDGLKDISDKGITIGLSEGVVRNISECVLFSDEVLWKNAYEKEFINILKECGRPYDILKLKSDITKELGIYQRKSISKLIRQVVTRRIDYVRVGVGYFEDMDRFAVIQRDAVSDLDLENYNSEDVIITPNENMTNQEKKENLKNIVTYFKVSPFYKKTGLPIDVSINEFIEETKVV